MYAITEYKAGSLVVFTSGEYSDYHFIGHFVVLRTMSVEEMAESAKEATKTAAGRSEAERAMNGLVCALIRAGFLLELNVEEIHIGYYRVDPRFGKFNHLPDHKE